MEYGNAIIRSSVRISSAKCQTAKLSEDYWVLVQYQMVRSRTIRFCVARVERIFVVASDRAMLAAGGELPFFALITYFHTKDLVRSNQYHRELYEVDML